MVLTYFCPWTLNLHIAILSCCALESTTQQRLSAIKVELELEYHALDEIPGNNKVWSGEEGFFSSRNIFLETHEINKMKVSVKLKVFIISKMISLDLGLFMCLYWLQSILGSITRFRSPHSII